MAGLLPGAGPSPTHYHANNDVCWYIMSGRIRCIQARSDCSNRKELILEAGDFVYVPSGAIHVVANASQTEEGVPRLLLHRRAECRSLRQCLADRGARYVCDATTVSCRRP
jgi:uncharacterized RmlC-like cupin family protein